MADPFQDMDAAGADFVKTVADAMDSRQSEGVMERIVATYLGKLEFSAKSVTVENGCGAGAVTRRIAAAASPGRVHAFDLSEAAVDEARSRLADVDNVSFAATGGAPLALEDGSADHVIMHTLLTHVLDPQPLVDDAARVLKPGGKLVICDCDFAKGTMRIARNDPLAVCGDTFIDEFVTDPYITSKLRPMALAAGLDIEDFSLTNRVVTESDGMIHWVSMTTANMVSRGEIGQPLADALVAEYQRRKEAGTLYGFQTFATLIASKPG